MSQLVERRARTTQDAIDHIRRLIRFTSRSARRGPTSVLRCCSKRRKPSDRVEHKIRGVDGRIVGTLVATATLIVLGFVALGVFTSIAGLLLAGTIAAVIGIVAGAVVEPGRSGRHAAVVAGYIAILMLGYLMLGQTAGRYAPPGSRGGPGVMPPRFSTIVALAAQGRFVPAQYRDGALPLIPVQAIAGGEVFSELAVSSSGVVSAVRTLRATPPFTDAMSNAVRSWRFRPAEEEGEPEPGKPVDPTRRKLVDSRVLVVGIFRPPTLNTPTVGEPPKDVASASDDTPFPLATVMPLYPPLARDAGIVLVEVRIDPRGGVVDAKAIRSAPPFDGPALDASRRWTFRPARVRGTSIAKLAYLVFAFRQPITVTPRNGSE